MANAPKWYDASVVAAVDGICTLLDGGKLIIKSGTQPALNGTITGDTTLATLTFSNPFETSNSASGGTVTATAGTITSETNATAGTAGYFALTKSDGTTVVGTGSVGTTGADLNLNSTTISSGATVSCSSFTITESQT